MRILEASVMLVEEDSVCVPPLIPCRKAVWLQWPRAPPISLLIKAGDQATILHHGLGDASEVPEELLMLRAGLQTGHVFSDPSCSLGRGKGRDGQAVLYWGAPRPTCTGELQGSPQCTSYHRAFSHAVPSGSPHSGTLRLWTEPPPWHRGQWRRPPVAAAVTARLSVRCGWGC